MVNRNLKLPEYVMLASQDNIIERWLPIDSSHLRDEKGNLKISCYPFPEGCYIEVFQNELLGMAKEYNYYKPPEDIRPDQWMFCRVIVKLPTLYLEAWK